MVKHRMYKILEAKELTTNIYLMVVEAPRVAKNCQPGQFVIVRMDKDGERIPLTICDYDREKGTARTKTSLRRRKFSLWRAASVQRQFIHR